MKGRLHRSGETVRGGATRFQRWLLLDGNRLLIAFVLSVGFFALLQLLSALGLVGFRDVSVVSRMASGLTAGSLSLITIVLTINQLILSQELGTAGKIQSRLDQMLEFRERIESTIGVTVTPARPDDMVWRLARATATTADALSSSVAEHPDEELREAVESYTDDVHARSTALADEVADCGAPLDALVATFEFDDDWYLHTGRYLRNSDDGELSEGSRERLEELIELLKLFDVGRSHFETIYLRRELANLSRIMLLVGVPAVIAAVLINLLYGATPAASVSAVYLPPTVGALTTVVFAPVALLSSYIFRTATVAYNNAAVGPMILREEYDRNLPERADEPPLD